MLYGLFFQRSPAEGTFLWPGDGVPAGVYDVWRAVFFSLSLFFRGFISEEPRGSAGREWGLAEKVAGGRRGPQVSRPSRARQMASKKS